MKTKTIAPTTGGIMPTTKIGVVRPSREHRIAYNDLCELLDKHAGKVDGLAFLAIAANMVGKIIAMQDQRYVTSEQAMNLVAKNIEQGNKEIRDILMDSKGSA